VLSSRRPTFSAENILPGHPDRVCDAIAETLVAHACSEDSEALVGVEVALHRSLVVVTGRVAGTVYAGALDEWPVRLDQETLERIVSDAFTSAGYTGRWAHPATVLADLDVGGLSPEERAIRGFSDDQTIATGYADPDGPRLLPVEAYAARRIKDALGATRAAHHELLGPDGKVLVTFEDTGGRPALTVVNVAIQHAAGVEYGELHDLVLPVVLDALDEISVWADPELEGDWFRLNGIGDFTCGGPMGDNGLSGKKLVVDFYGPRVAIGGGAICGKDVHKPDRVGALRARQVARLLAAATGQQVHVEMGWLPGLEAPDRLSARLADGRRLSRGEIEREIALPDLTLAGSAKELELASVPWPQVMRDGYFGAAERSWER
jgi:S-adenosylmethionine synthetase